jgi:pheromone shutdown protein TraB
MGSGADESGSIQIIGTAHVSQESADEVQSVITEERPDIVAVELDESRYRQLKGEQTEDLSTADILRGNTVFQFLAYWMLSYIQTRLGDRFDVSPGADMLAAIETAEAQNADVALVDRDINETIRRFWNRMRLREKFQLLFGLLAGGLDSVGVGIGFGIIGGLIIGPIIAIFGSSFGITSVILTKIAGGVVLGVAGGVMTWAVMPGEVGIPRQLAVVGIVGVVVGGGGSVLFDVATVIGQMLTPWIAETIGSISIGLFIGVVSGTAVSGLSPSPMTGQEEYTELDVSELTDTDVVSAMMHEFRQFSPGGASALIDERDAYIAHKLIQLRASGADVIAVVGAGHQEGINQYLNTPSDLPPMETLSGTQGSSIPWAKMIGGIISLTVIAFFILIALSSAENEILLRLFGAWFFINGIFATGLAKLAGAKWKSSLVGGAVAWLTSINPFLAPGWFAGYFELQYTSVNIADINQLNRLLTNEELALNDLVNRMFHVPLFRLIIIVAATNIGSFIASALFIAYLLPLFALDLGGAQGILNLLIEGAKNGLEILWKGFR